MITHNTLHEDVLDILFADRNKAYGAYALRRNYPDRLRKSIGIMLGTLAVLSAVVVWEENRGDRPMHPVDLPPFRSIPVVLQPAPQEPIQHPRVLPRQSAQPSAPVVRPAATAAITPPLLVDQVDPSKAMPDLSALDPAQVGPSPTPGDQRSGAGAVQGATGGKDKQGEEVVLDIVERMPSFPGGEEALRRFFMRYLQFPEDADAGDQVRVIIRFVVGKDGTLSTYGVTQSGGQLFDSEVIRVLKKMPNWTPGVQNGRPVSVYFNLPVTFMRPGN